MKKTIIQILRRYVTGAHSAERTMTQKKSSSYYAHIAWDGLEKTRRSKKNMSG